MWERNAGVGRPHMIPKLIRHAFWLSTLRARCSGSHILINRLSDGSNGWRYSARWPSKHHARLIRIQLEEGRNGRDGWRTNNTPAEDSGIQVARKRIGKREDVVLHVFGTSACTYSDHIQSTLMSTERMDHPPRAELHRPEGPCHSQ